MWDLKGTRQTLKKSDTRKRSAAYPFEIPYRLINMYSLKGDTILDPFLGTGTTTLAAIAAQRNSVGYEIDPAFSAIVEQNIESLPLSFYNAHIYNRVEKHKQFLEERNADTSKAPIKHFNEKLNMQVMTAQEREINFSFVTEVAFADNIISAHYRERKPEESEIPFRKNSETSLSLV